MPVNAVRVEDESPGPASPDQPRLKSDPRSETDEIYYNDSQQQPKGLTVVTINDLDEPLKRMIEKAVESAHLAIEQVQAEKKLFNETREAITTGFQAEREKYESQFKAKMDHLQKFCDNIQNDLQAEMSRRNREKSDF